MKKRLLNPRLNENFKFLKKLQGHHIFREGDYNPVELAWCAYLKKDQYETILEKYAGIADEIKAHTTIERKSIAELFR